MLGEVGATSLQGVRPPGSRRLLGHPPPPRPALCSALPWGTASPHGAMGGQPGLTPRTGGAAVEEGVRGGWCSWEGGGWCAH